MKKIAIIGAGWTGIGILRVLKEKGFYVTVYEKNNDIGGTWHPDNNYARLKVHSMAYTMSFPDFPLPDHIDPCERLNSSEVFNYLKQYCQHHHLLEHIHLNSCCEKISYDSKQQKHTLHINQNNKNYQVEDFDYVIYTHGLTERTIPNFKGADSFTGEIYHSYDVSEKKLKKLTEENKKIVVIGGSKTATDFILTFHDLDYQVNWLCRSPYWFFNLDTQKKLLVSHNKKISAFFKRWFLISGYLFVKNMPKLTSWLWRSTNSIHSYAQCAFDLHRFHAGILDQQQMQILKKYYQKNAITSEIESINNELILLKNGTHLKADVLICCTGSGPKTFPKITIDGLPVDLEQVNKIYHSAVLPQLPKLIYTIYLPFSIGIIRGLLAANWIESYIKFAPDTDYLFKHAKDILPGHLMNHSLFNSKGVFLVDQMEKVNEFFNNREIAFSAYIKWFFDHGFSGKPLKPFEFKVPKKTK